LLALMQGNVVKYIAMNLKKVSVHAPQALVAATVLACLVAGCGKDEEKKPLPEVYSAEGHAYMKDPAFKAKLQAQDKARTTILDEREALIAEAAALEQKCGSRAAAETNAAYKALMQRMHACEAAFETNRAESAKILRERMLQAERDTERIQRGEARAKDISK